MPDQAPFPDDQVKQDFMGSRAVTQLQTAEQNLEALSANPPAAPAAVQAPPTPVPLGQRIWNGVKAVSSDIGMGIVKSPKEIFGGALDYVNNAFRFADDVVKKAESAGLPNVYLQWADKDGNWDPRMLTTAEFRKAQKEGSADVFQIPTTGPEHTVTGNIVRTAATFLIGRGNLAGKGAGLLANAGASFASGATAGMNPNQARLSNIVDSIVPNFLTDFLKAKPEDEGTMLGHLKSGMEMAGLDLAVGGVVRAVKALKNSLTAPEAPAEASATAAEPKPAAPVATPPAAEAEVAAGEPTAPQTSIDIVGGVNEPPAQKTPMQAILDMQEDLPWQQATGVREPLPPGTGLELTAQGRQAMQDAGWPTGTRSLDVAPKETPPVRIEPTMKANFDKFLEQERSGAAPLEANEAPLAGQRSADFSATGSNPVKVNLNMINGLDDLKDAVARVSSQIPAQAVRPNEEVLRTAGALAMEPEDFAAKAMNLIGEGRPLTDEEVAAFRMIVNSSSEQMLGAARKATAAGATAEDQAQALATFAKNWDMMQALEQSKVASGRSTQAWGIRVGGAPVPYTQAVQKIVEAAGGPEGIDAQKLLEQMSQLETPEQVSRFVAQQVRASPRDITMGVYYNALLGTRTVVKKLTSDAFMSAWNIATRYATEKLGSGAVPQGETAELVNGYVGSFKDAVRLAGKALRAGESQFYSQFRTLDAFDADRLAALGEGADAALSAENATRGWTSYLRSALPTSWIGAADDFAKYANYRAALRALAYRSGVKQGMEGAALDGYITETMNVVPRGLHVQALSEALARTFQDPLTGIGEQIGQLADNINIPLPHTSYEIPLGRLVLPFVKVPVNIARWGYRNTWLSGMFPSQAASAELAAGGATRELAIVSRTMGSLVALTGLGMALDNQLTGRGPSDPELRRAWMAAGNKPYWFNPMGTEGGGFGYNQVEPLGMVMGTLADTVDIMKFSKEEEAARLAESFAFGAGNAMLSKTYLQGFSNLLETMNNPDAKSANYVNNFISAWVPSDIKGFRRSMDPWMRSHYDLLESVQNRLPFLSKDLPIARTIWGDPIPTQDAFMPFATGSGAARWVSPIPVASDKEQIQPIDQWIWEHRKDFPNGPENKLGLSVPGIVQNFSAGAHVKAQVELTPEQHDRLVVLGGNELKDPGTNLGARDTLNSLIAGDHPSATMQRQWDNASDATRALIVQATVNKFREAAKKQLIDEYPDLKDIVTSGWQQRAQQLQAAPAQ